MTDDLKKRALAIVESVALWAGPPEVYTVFSILRCSWSVDTPQGPLKLVFVPRWCTFKLIAYIEEGRMMGSTESMNATLAMADAFGRRFYEHQRAMVARGSKR